MIHTSTPKRDRNTAFGVPSPDRDRHPSTSGYRQVILQDEPVLYLPLTETSGTTAIDVSGNNLNGTYIGGFTLAQSSPKGGGVLLDGVSGYVFVSSSSLLNFTTAFSLEFWWRPSTTATSENYLLCKGSNRYAVLWEYANDTIELFGSGVDLRTGTQITISSTDWRHVVYTYNGSSVRGFINGVQVLSVSRSITLITDTDPLIIGGANNLGLVSNYTQGSFAHVALYSKSIENRVADHYSA